MGEWANGRLRRPNYIATAASSAFLGTSQTMKSLAAITQALMDQRFVFNSPFRPFAASPIRPFLVVTETPRSFS
jgi:hypothetical protein